MSVPKQNKNKKACSQLGGYSVELHATETGDVSLRDERKSGASNQDKELASPFPFTSIYWCENGMILAPGGGGPMKSGIGNGFEILKLNNVYNVSTNSFENILERHSWFNTDSELVYGIAVHPKYPYQMIAAVSNSLVVFEITTPFDSTQKPFEFEWKWSPLSISSSNNSSNNKNGKRNESPIKTLSIHSKIEKMKVDLNTDALFVGCLAINKEGTFIATGGRDGIARIFNFDFITAKLSSYDEINIRKIIETELKEENMDGIEIEKLKFNTNMNTLTSNYLAICNCTDCCFIYDIKCKSLIQRLYVDGNNKSNFICRDCVFVLDATNYYFNNEIIAINKNENKNKNENQKRVETRKRKVYYEYVVIGINRKRNRQRKEFDTESYLYKYCINQEFELIDKFRIIKSQLKSMVYDNKTNCIVSLHFNGNVCISDALNMKLLQKIELTCDSQIFMEIALQPYQTKILSNSNNNNDNNNKKKNIDTRCLIVVLAKSIIVKEIELPNCNIGARNNNEYSNNCCCACCFGWCCSAKSLTWFFTVFVVFVAMFMGIVLQQTSLMDTNSQSMHYHDSQKTEL